MNSEQRQEYVKKALLGLWAMLTVILVVALGLVVSQMIQHGQSPFPQPPAAALAEDTSALPETLAPAERRRDVALYFASEDGRLLVPEMRRLTLGDDTVENVHIAFDALVEGPTGVLAPVAPPSTRARGVFLMGDGELVVDLSMETVSGLRKHGSISSEMLFLQGMVHTLTGSELLEADAAPIATVRFLIEGASAEETFQDAHCDWTIPIARNARWLAGNQPVEPGDG